MNATSVSSSPAGSTELPQWAQDFLASCPRAGTGVHNWLFKAALKLHRIISDDGEIIQLLCEATANCGRVVDEREISEAVKNSAETARQPGLYLLAPRWPKAKQEQIDTIAKTGPTVADLEKLSPIKFTGGKPHTEEIVDHLYQGNPWLCVGRSQSRFCTERREALRDHLPRMQFIVPSPMNQQYGLTKDGRRSMHTLDNTGPRRFIVVECDGTKWEELPERERSKHGTEAQYRAAKKDEQASVLLHLARFAPLTLIVDSGGKSLHGWYFCEGQSETLLRKFMRLAVSLGADPATWSRCHFVRMPDGRRDNGTRQAIKFFNPETLKNK